MTETTKKKEKRQNREVQLFPLTQRGLAMAHVREREERPMTHKRQRERRDTNDT